MTDHDERNALEDALTSAARMQATFLEEQMALHGVHADEDEEADDSDTLTQARAALAECCALLECTRAGWLARHNELVFSGCDSDALGARIDALDDALLALERDAAALDTLAHDT